MQAVLDEKKLDQATVEELCEVLAGRAAFYRSLAEFYYEPLTQARIDQLAEQDFESFAVGDELIDAGFNDMRRALRKRHTGTRSILATEWTGIFGGAESYKGRYCIPEASLFLDDEGSMYGWPREDARRIYGQQRLQLQNDAGLPESHLSFELEFLAVMSEEAAACLRAGRTDEALDKLAVSRDFIEKHVLTWVPELMDLASNMFRTRFYRGVMRVTLGYLRLDLQTIDDVRAEVSGS